MKPLTNLWSAIMAILHKTFVYIFGFCNVVVVEYTQKSYEFDVAVWGGEGFFRSAAFQQAFAIWQQKWKK